MHYSIPGAEFANADEALQQLIRPGARVSVAAAFVSHGGAQRLIELTAGKAADVTLAARAADITDPDALLWLQQRGVTVSVVIGKGARRYHPKLWLIDDPNAAELVVLSGSGNLTRGGLSSNTEQFEVFGFPRGSAGALEQAERFGLLVAAAYPLAEVTGQPIWGEWLEVRRFADKQPLLREVEKRWERLDDREVKLDRVQDRAELVADLLDLYHRTVAAKLPRADGKPYVPSRFYQAIRRAEAGESDPVVLVRSICDKQTGGFDVIVESGEKTLTVEWLVLDSTKPYHDLFGDRTRALSRVRLEQFGF